LTAAAERLDRAARDLSIPATARLPRSDRCAQLRAQARALLLWGRIHPGDDTVALLRMMLRVARLADMLAQLRRAQDRLHQARAARAAAAMVRSVPVPGAGMETRRRLAVVAVTATGMRSMGGDRPTTPPGPGEQRVRPAAGGRTP